MIVPENATPEECRRTAEGYFPKRSALERAIISQEIDASLWEYRTRVTSLAEVTSEQA